MSQDARIAALYRNHMGVGEIAAAMHLSGGHVTKVLIRDIPDKERLSIRAARRHAGAHEGQRAIKAADAERLLDSALQ